MGFNTSAIRFWLATKNEIVTNPKTLVIGRQTFRPSLFLLYAMKRRGLVKETNKISYVDDFLECSGINKLDFLDFSPYEGANVLHDLSQPISENLKNVYDLVIEAGTIEHVPDILIALNNLKSLVKAGGHLLIVAPGNQFFGHGCYQLSPEFFYRALSPDQGFWIEYFVIHEEGALGGRWRVIPDAAEVGKRIDLMTRRPTYICILAKKIETVTTKVGNQSDYEAAWNRELQTSMMGSFYLKSPYILQRIADVLILQVKHRREMNRLLTRISVQGLLRSPVLKKKNSR
jgi:SAM-dependent methyltransferase